MFRIRAAAAISAAESPSHLQGESFLLHPSPPHSFIQPYDSWFAGMAALWQECLGWEREAEQSSIPGARAMVMPGSGRPRDRMSEPSVLGSPSQEQPTGGQAPGADHKDTEGFITHLVQILCWLTLIDAVLKDRQELCGPGTRDLDSGQLFQGGCGQNTNWLGPPGCWFSDL